MSSSSPTQEHRRAAVSTDLGEDEFVLHRMVGTEQLGRLFKYTVEAYSLNREVDPNKMLGTNVTVRLETHDDGTRYFNGVVSRFAQIGQDRKYAHYEITLRPWFWLLTRTADCRIFQNKSVPDIIKKIFSDAGFSDVNSKAIKGNHPTWEFNVQYRETDFNYISRLMEQEGISYFFEHENGKHTLVMFDDPSAHKPFPKYEDISFYSEGESDDFKDYINDWVLAKEIQPGHYALKDWNPIDVGAEMFAKKSKLGSHPHAKGEIFDYPGEYTKKGDGDSYAQWRIEELAAQHEIVEGAGTARGVTPGYTFTLKEYFRSDQNREYLIVSAQHDIQSDEFRSGGDEDPTAPLYVGSFTAIPSTVLYRTPRVTQKPLIQGPQTAVVTGKAGEEIYPDQYARVKVQFHWDRESKADENSSCWIRVSQPWAGKQWGFMHIPRIGHEVIVEFMEGDPDRPIITGRVYNDINKVPYALDTNKTLSGWKSNSSKGGQGFNEFRFEDKKGEEQIFMHGEKDLDIRIKNDRKEYIGNDRHLLVENDMKDEIKHDYDEKVGNDHRSEIVNDESMKVGNDQKINIVGNKSEKVDKEFAMEVGQKAHLKVGTKYTITATNIVLQASNNITLKGADGKSFLSLDSGGIKLNATAPVVINSSAKMDVKAGAILTISGTMVKIN